MVSDVDNTSFSYSVSTPTKGSVSINAAGLWTYAPSVNSNGADSFTVTVFDGSGASVAQTISLTVNPVNDAPIITSSASASGNEDTSISASVVVSDVDNTSFSYSVSTPTKGSVSINSSGLWTYAPSANSNGADIFTVTVFDGSGASVAQTISLTVNPVNDAAIFGGSRSAALTEDAGIYIASGTAIVTDIDGSAEAAFSSTYSAASGNRGSFLFDPANGGWSYSVANANLQSLGAGLTHQDVLHLASVDGTSGSLSVVLTGVDDPAVISGTFSGSVTEDVASTLTVSGQLSVTDVDGAAESLFLTNVTSQNGNRGSLSVTSDGLWTYILDNSLVQPLAENATYIDSFILSSVGGTTTSISVTVFGKADPLGPLSLALGHPQLSLGVLSAAVVDDGTGASVAMLGDVNGDGFDDYLIGQSAISKGAAVLVFGSPSISNLSLASLSASQGITISGATSGDHAGEVVANLGDFTSESSGAIYHDFALGNPDAASGSGSVNILFGKTSAWSSINLASLSTTVGISVTGAGAGAALGSSIAALGDINGDSFADILLGAPGSGNGAAWIVFGKLGDPLVGDYSNINLSSASASTAIAITGSTSASGFGGSAAGLGDVNGDGYADFLVGAAAANEAWLFFGGDGAWNANASLATPPSGAVRLAGVAASGAGHSVSAAGDVNGDGYADFLVASSGLGKVQLIFGKTGTWSGLDLSSLGSAGINLAGAGADAVLSSAGDVNGDGYADFLIGSASQEKSFLIFGKASGWADLDLATLAYPDGCVISSAPGALGGSAVSGGGDVNGDGFDDLLLGRPGSDSAVLISGGDFSDGLAGLIRGSGSFSGTSGADLLIGSTAADTITLLAGADVVHAGAGDDTIVVSSNSFRVIDGGGGTDTVKLSGSSLNLNLSTHGPDAWQGIEAVNLNGSSNRITLALEDALGHTLRINGDESNSVDLDLSQYSGFLRDTAFEDGLHYWFYEHDYLQNAFILIENGIAVV